MYKYTVAYLSSLFVDSPTATVTLSLLRYKARMAVTFLNLEVIKIKQK